MILLIDNYDSFTYNLYQELSVLHEKVLVVRNDQISCEEIAALDLAGIVLSPGPGRPEDTGICMDVIREFGPKIPILGVCLGHQAIGAFFGGTISRAPKILHGKESLIFHRRGPLFQNVPLPFKAGRYHSLIVESANLPEELIVEAEDADGYIMALSHQTYPIFGVQFHPESILTPDGALILKNFVEMCTCFV